MTGRINTVQRCARFGSVLLLGFSALFVAPRSARAQATTDKAVAESLFREGKRLMAQKKFDEACAKLSESYHLSNGTGTLINLAGCEEARGNTASAWTYYVTAVAAAKRENREDRASFADARVKALEPQLSRISVQPTSRVPGLEVRLDGAVLPSAAYGVATPVDPGDHVVAATAPGYERWEQQVHIGTQAQNETVRVPALSKALVAAASKDGGTHAEPLAGHQPEPAPGAPSEATHDSNDSSRLTTPVLIAGGLTVAAGAGAVFMSLRYVSAKDKYNDANADPLRVGERQSLHDDAASIGLVATVLTGAALVGVGVTTFFLLKAPSKESPSSAMMVPWALPQSGGLSVTGTL